MAQVIASDGTIVGRMLGRDFVSATVNGAQLSLSFYQNNFPPSAPNADIAVAYLAKSGVFFALANCQGQGYIGLPGTPLINDSRCASGIANSAGSIEQFIAVGQNVPPTQIALMSVSYYVDGSTNTANCNSYVSSEFVVPVEGVYDLNVLFPPPVHLQP